MTCTSLTAKGRRCKRPGGWLVDGATVAQQCYGHAVDSALDLNLTTVLNLERARVVDVTGLPEQPRLNGRFTSQRIGVAA